MPQAWILNLKKMQLEVYRNPADGEYGPKETFDRGTAVASQAFPHVEIEWW